MIDWFDMRVHICVSANYVLLRLLVGYNCGLLLAILIIRETILGHVGYSALAHLG